MNQTINQENLNSSLRFLDKMAAVGVEQLKSTDPARAQQLKTLGALLSEEGFCKQLAACAEDKQAAIQLFGDNGVVLTEEDISGLLTQLNTITQTLLDNDGSLSEEELEKIAGGASGEAWAAGVGGGVAGAVIGGLLGSILLPGIGSAIGFLIGGGLAGYFAGNAVESSS